ncbi:Rieske (2Fe-2S) protein [Actinomadura rudentiformis]|uniref:Uncharacterized protein n=1 Tax=Actinomadura rudentiformis TaxID=359158 RepID=A0A6H9Z529_9ACTN|nr:hypothetical protein [Actinomadura rudentiformis]KAB2349749.1 hypothetical protein F8566_13515 [Actinomadura rudentiformis]
MTRSINDLREILDVESDGAPRNADRITQVETRIRRRRKRRVTAGAALGVTAAALTVTGVYALPGSEQDPAQALDTPGTYLPQGQEALTPPLVYQGMRRIALKRFTATGKMMRMEFTPVGPDTAYIIRCRPGYEVIEQTDGNGGYGSFGDCASDVGPPQSVSASALEPGALTAGERHVLDVVVLPKGTVKENVIEYMTDDESGGAPDSVTGTDGNGEQITLSEYLATHKPGTSPWTVAIYSGECEGDC